MNTNLVINRFALISGRPDFRGQPKETVDEYLAQGGKIKKIPSNCRNDYPARWAWHTHAETEFGMGLWGMRI